MDDQVLIHILETACAEESLIFQVIEQEGYLHIFLNREAEQVLDYRVVGKKIYRALSRLTLTGIDGVYLYSRILGKEEPDWETRFRLPPVRSLGEAQAAQVKAQAGQATAQVEQAAQATASESAPQAEPVAQLAGPAPNEAQRRISEADTFIVRGGDTAIGTQTGGLVEHGDDARSPVQSLTAIPDDETLATAARVKARAAAAPAPEASQYPLSDTDGATEAAAAYEAAETTAPTVSVVAEAAVLAARAAEAIPQRQKQQGASAGSEADFDLTQHCFIRNRMLLTSDIALPSATVARQIRAFHELPMEQKRLLMPQLVLFFKGAPTFSVAGLSGAQQAWFEAAKALTGDDARKLPVWLSRYCLDAEATLVVIARGEDPSLAVAKSDRLVEVEVRANIGSQGYGSKDCSPAALSRNSRTQNALSGGAAHSISGSIARAAASRPSGPQRGGFALRGFRRAVANAKEASTATQWLWPGIVVMGALVLMCLGMLLVG